MGDWDISPAVRSLREELLAIRRDIHQHPELAVDPVLAAAHIITGLQALVSRETPPLQPAVLSILVRTTRRLLGRATWRRAGREVRRAGGSAGTGVGSTR